MNILIASSEVVPFAKTGGLADVGGALPIELERLGHRPFVFMPGFRSVYTAGQPVEPLGVEFNIPIGSKISKGSLAKSVLPGSEVDVFIVQQPEYFERAELYREAGEDYPDNCERFVFFCRAVMESIHFLDLQVDVLHGNDWQAGLLAAYLALEYRRIPGFEKIASLLTIHNLAYQGNFSHWDMALTGLDWKHFNWQQMEFYGRLNLLKTGLVFADALNTVSPSYATEIQSSDLGCGLEGVLRHRAKDLSGIINGVDYDIWNPESDSRIAKNYDVTSWKEGKSECKKSLQKAMNLPESDGPLVGLVGRLASQKGWHLIIEVMKTLVSRFDMQWTILGTGEPEYHRALKELAEAFPDKVGIELGFSDDLAHQIEAGSDIFLMPSQYEPCGLNQLYSLKYGTVPVVHATGGLADTIINLDQESQLQKTATGFSFYEYHADALLAALRRATDVYSHNPDLWQQIVTNGMQQDWSWSQSARAYISLYERLIDRKASASVDQCSDE